MAEPRKMIMDKMRPVPTTGKSKTPSASKPTGRVYPTTPTIPTDFNLFPSPDSTSPPDTVIIDPKPKRRGIIESLINIPISAGSYTARGLGDFAEGVTGLGLDIGEKIVYETGLNKKIEPLLSALAGMPVNAPSVAYQYKPDPNSPNIVTVGSLEEVPEKHRKFMEQEQVNPSEIFFTSDGNFGGASRQRFQYEIEHGEDAPVFSEVSLPVMGGPGSRYQEAQESFMSSLGRDLVSFGTLLDPDPQRMADMTDFERDVIRPASMIPAFGLARNIFGGKAGSKIKALTYGPPRQPQIAGDVVVETDTVAASAIQKLRNLLSTEGLKGKVSSSAEEVTEQRGERFSKFAQDLTKADDVGFEQTMVATGKLKGEYTRGTLEDFQDFIKTFTPDEISALQARVWEVTKEGFGRTAIQKIVPGPKLYDSKDSIDYLNNMKAFSKIFNTKELPTPSEIKRLERMFGSEVAESLLDMQKRSDKVKNRFFDTWNAGKALLASLDVSAAGRQGWKLAFSPYWKQYMGSIGPMFKMLDPEFGAVTFDDITKSIKTNKHYNEVVKEAGDIFDIMELSTTRGRKISQTEDVYISDWVQRIPGIRLSEQAYTGFLNKLRWDSVYKQLDEWVKQGYEYTSKDVRDLTELINYSTGRGSVPKSWVKGDAGRVLNAAFFSPRYLYSIPQFYVEGLTAGRVRLGSGAGVAGAKGLQSEGFSVRTAELSKIHAKILVGHITKNMAILGGIYGGAKAKEKITGEPSKVQIGFDPRASNFGKIEFGPMKYDFWGGDMQIMKLFARTIPGVIPGVDNKRKTVDGLLKDTDVMEEITRFLRSKLAPTTGYTVDIFAKEDFLGNEVVSPLQLETAEEVQETFLRRLTVLFVQDLVDAISIENTTMTKAEMIGGASLGLLGVGVGLYETSKDKKNDLAIEIYGSMYDDLDSFQQDNIDINPDYLEWQTKANAGKRTPNADKFWEVGMNRYNAIKEEEEAVLLNVLQSNPTNIQRTNAIKSFLSKKASIFNAVIPQNIQDARVVQQMERGRRSDIIDMFRSMYFDAPLYEDPRTGIKDYTSHQQFRTEILTSAVNAGIPSLEITRYSPASGNPVIAQAVDNYRRNNDYLRVNFFDVSNQFLKQLGYYDKYRVYQASQYRSSMKKADPQLGKIEKRLRELKQRLRKLDPNIEIALWQNGDLQISAFTNPAALAAINQEVVSQ